MPRSTTPSAAPSTNAQGPSPRAALLFALLVVGGATAHAQVSVTATAGTTGPTAYTNLRLAFAAVNAGTHQGDIVVDITSSPSTDNNTAVLNASGSGSASYSSVLVQPSGSTGARTISGTISGGPLIDLNGADHVTIDGRTGDGYTLTLSNQSTATTTATSTIRFQNDATSNTIVRCKVLGRSTGSVAVLSGNIILASTSGSTGNDNNTIEDCDIGNDGTSTTNLMSKAIVSVGSTGSLALHNSGNKVKDCRILNFFITGGSRGVLLGAGNHAWGITGNKFYQEAARTSTTANSEHFVIDVASGSSNSAGGHAIEGNTIGFANASGTGTWTLDGGNTHRFRAISFHAAMAGPRSSIGGNTIAGISHASTHSGQDAGSPCTMVYVDNGRVDVHGNTIGSQTGTGSITCTPSGQARHFHAVLNVSSTDWSVKHNLIGSITVGSNSSALYGIRSLAVTGTLESDSNTVGGVTTNSMHTTGASAHASIHGIALAGGTVTATGNLVRNLRAEGHNSAAATANGITVTGGTLHSTGNTVRKVHSGNRNVRGFALSGATVTMTGDSILELSSGASNKPDAVAHGVSAVNTVLTVSGCRISGVGIGNIEAAGIFATGGSVQVHGSAISGIDCWGIWGGTLACGIRVVDAPLTATGNTIANVTGTGRVPEGGSAGIVVANTAGAHAVVLRGNTVHTMGTGTGDTEATGIRAALSGSGNTIERNLVHSLRLSTGSVSTATFIRGIHLVSGTGTVRNNMVRLGITEAGAAITSPWQTYGIHVAGGAFSVLHNSVYIGGAGVTGTARNTFALLSEVPGTRDYRNNILWNARSGTGSHYAIGVNGNLTGLTSDHNCLRVSGTGGVLGWQGGTDRANLAAWQSATGKDVNSLSINPGFVNATGNAANVDLHLNSNSMGISAMNEAGASGTGVQHDFDMNARKPQPEIGAHETWGPMQSLTVHTRAWVRVLDRSLLPDTTGGGLSASAQLDSIFNAHGVTVYKQALPFARSKWLRQVHEIKASGDLAPAYTAMALTFPGAFANFSKHTIMPYPSAAYDPPDSLWQLTMLDPNEHLWHLKKTQCDSAWNITQGDSTIRLAILDSRIDGTHPDLQSKLVLPFDALDSIPFDCTVDLFYANHGTQVAGFAAAETADTTQTPLGPYAAAGFKCMIVGYGIWGDPMQTFLEKALHASTVMDARTITSCFGAGMRCGAGIGEIETIKEVMAEIFANGTCIVCPAGNGRYTGEDCFGDTPGSWAPFFPFHPDLDERVIVVASSSRDDKHGWTLGGDPHVHSHFPQVDICAPGYGMLGVDTTSCGNNEWPYEYGATGTSFASPLVAGICGLILSVNPCLGAEDVQAIIKATADPVLDSADFPGMVGAGRINAYKACLMAQGYGSSATVTGTETWGPEVDHFINGDIVIDSGAVLTLHGKLRFMDNARLIVKPGGRLVLDGGTLTKGQGCTGWPGVEVWGTTSQHQFPVDSPRYQGLVIMRNGAVIEHALTGIVLGNPNDTAGHGGVVQVLGTSAQPGGTFLNCRRAVDFPPYRNFHHGAPHVPLPNYGLFNFAEFIVDNGYRGGGEDFQEHVRLHGVDGVIFRACRFENASEGVTQASKLGKGIHSLDAHFSVVNHCSVIPEYPEPCTGQSYPTTFIGLDHGIHALGGQHGHGFIVDQCDFDNNVIGVYASQIPGFTVGRSILSTGWRNVELDGEFYQDFTLPHHRCIFADQCHSFRIEENTLTRFIGGAGADGIVIGNSGATNSQVYKNVGRRLDNGYIGEGVCMDTDSSDVVGLQFLCNINQGNDWNIWARVILTQEPSPDPDFHGIRTVQGIHDAGNRFDQDTLVMDESDLRVTTAPEWHITYMHNDSIGGGLGKPKDYTMDRVTLLDTTAINHCPSLFQSPLGPEMTGGGQSDMHWTKGGERGERAEELRTRFSEAKAAYLERVNASRNLIDGGNTGTLLNLIRGSRPQDTRALHDTLMRRSPYLSMEVLMEAMRSGTLPDSLLMGVLQANPDATRRADFMAWARTGAPVPLGQAMEDSIRASWRTRTARTGLHIAMGRHHSDMSVAGQLLLDLYRQDSLGVPMDSVLALWQRFPGHDARYAEAWNSLGMGDHARARSVIAALDAAHPTDAARIGDRDRALELIGLIGNARNNGRSIMRLERGEIARLEALARNDGQAAGRARNILCFGYGICYPARTGGAGEQAPPGPREEKAREPITQRNVLQVYPNPTNGTVTFAHGAGTPLENAFVVVLDALGREVARLHLGGHDRIVWDARNIPPGSYLVELFSGQSRLAVERLVVQP